MNETILVLGAGGQIGTELVIKLVEIYGYNSVIASDIRAYKNAINPSFLFVQIDATNKKAIDNVVIKHKVTQIYNLVAMLSASAEKNPKAAWHLNMTSHFNVLEIAKERRLNKVFWPSSIACFGSETPKINTPQFTTMNPTTVYGISKLTGEFWNHYYHKNYGIDVRSIRYPGLISWKTKPGGGTTDYAVEIFTEALSKGSYTSFLEKDTKLPMMYMEDAIKATTQLMEADCEQIQIRTSYNVTAISFTPQELAKEIKKTLPHFTMLYKPDFRQEIANTWPQSINDSKARKDWGWQHQFNLEQITQCMIKNLQDQRFEAV